MAYSEAALARAQRALKQQQSDHRERQAALRREYVDAVKQSLQGHLDHTVLLRPDGTKEKLEKKQ